MPPKRDPPKELRVLLGALVPQSTESVLQAGDFEDTRRRAQTNSYTDYCVTFRRLCALDDGQGGYLHVPVAGARAAKSLPILHGMLMLPLDVWRPLQQSDAMLQNAIQEARLQVCREALDTVSEGTLLELLPRTSVTILVRPGNTRARAPINAFFDQLFIRSENQVRGSIAQSDDIADMRILQVARTWALKPYQPPPQDALCVFKAPKAASARDDPRTTWIRALSQVPGVSERKAEYIADKVPSMRALFLLCEQAPSLSAAHARLAKIPTGHSRLGPALAGTADTYPNLIPSGVFR
ncbi:MAG: hypothetical protein MHM6MM_000726 [Cercozoa sp. M6MM]